MCWLVISAQQRRPEAENINPRKTAKKNYKKCESSDGNACVFRALQQSRSETGNKIKINNKLHRKKLNILCMKFRGSCHAAATQRSHTAAAAAWP